MLWLACQRSLQLSNLRLWPEQQSSEFHLDHWPRCCLGWQWCHRWQHSNREGWQRRQRWGERATSWGCWLDARRRSYDFDRPLRPLIEDWDQVRGSLSGLLIGSDSFPESVICRITNFRMANHERTLDGSTPFNLLTFCALFCVTCPQVFTLNFNQNQNSIKS